jgi:tRNA nucleotidyltransferase/poly(A) polymerase
MDGKGRAGGAGGAAARKARSASAAEKAVADALRRDRPLRAFLLAVARAVSGSGGALFLAGGFLRDLASGKPGADVDAMVAGLSRRELGEALESLPRERLGIRKVVPAGRHFPVFRVATRWSGRYVDVSEARGPADAPGPGPRSRALSDAARRDFTINSMLYALVPRGNRLEGELIDAFGGVADLARRTIRCVGSPEERLREDPARALRAIRMKRERKGFRIDPATLRAIRRLGPALLPGVPADRIAGELVRSLRADPAGTLDDLARSGILRALLPELARRKGGTARARKRYASLSRSRSGPLPPAVLLANLLLDLPPAEAEAAARRLRLPGVKRVVATASDVRALLRPGGTRFPLSRTEELLARHAVPGPAAPFIALYRAAAACDGLPARNLKRFLARCAETPRLVTGSDLKRMGFPEGPGREEALLAVREAALSGKIADRESALRLAREAELRMAREAAQEPARALRRAPTSAPGG